MSSLGKAFPRRVVSLKVSYDLQTRTFRMPAFIQITPGEFIENPALEPLQAQATSLRVVDGDRTNV